MSGGDRDILSAMPPQPTLSTRRKLLFGVIVALMAFTLVEVVLRLALGPPPPGVRVFGSLRSPAQKFSVAGAQVSKTYLPNGRATDPPFPVDVDGQRVAVVGESSVHMGTAGLGLDREFPGLLEAKLGVPVVNLGAPGLDSFDIVQIVEQMTAYDFSVLVVYTGHNDMGNTWFEQRYGTLSAGLGLRMRVLLDQLHVFGALRRAVGDVQGQARRGGNTQSQVPALSTVQRVEAARLFKANLDRMVWLAHDHGMAVVLATPISLLGMAPLSDWCDEDGECANTTYARALETAKTDRDASRALFERARDLDGKPMRAPSAITDAVRDVARERRTWLVDLERTVPQETSMPVPQSALFNDFVHLSPTGHVLLAQLLEPAVKEALAAEAKH